MSIEIHQWLEQLGLDEYSITFAANRIDVNVLPTLTNEDLKDIGVLVVGDRRRLLNAISALANQDNKPTRGPDGSDQKPGEAIFGVSASRRQVTVLFADISGFTTLSCRLDAEETHALLNDFFAVVDSVVGAYGGAIDKHIGDAVMAVFGAPLAHTDDPERALRAALDIHDGVARLEPPLQVHIGVASGQVVASSTGSSEHMEYTITGDSVNLAARLTDKAKAGETLASASVQRALGDRFIGVNLGEQPIDGFLEPVTLWRLDELGAGRPGGSHAFVGRSRELRQFSTALDSCLETRAGETFIVRGEAGIGKTRLVEQFVDLAGSKGFAVHTGLILDFGTAKGQDAIRALVRSLLEIPVDSGQATRSEAAQRAIGSGKLPEVGRVHLNDLLDLPQPPDLNGIYQAMDSETRNRGKQNAVGDLVRHASQSRPLLLRVEDAHWADPLILAHLANLTRAVQNIPALLILTTRITADRLDQAWRAGTAGAPLTTHDLGPLHPSEANELARDFKALNDEMITACVERSGGNPLFLEQLLRNADDLKAGAIPGTVQGIVQARLDVLPSNDRAAIQAASVLGQRFSRAALAALLDTGNYDPVNLLRNVLIRPDGDDYLFAHALIREGVYASMLRPRRKDIHRRAARWFQGDDPILHAEHLDEAEEPDAAKAYLDAAVGEAKARRHERARQLVERALELDATPEVRFDIACVHGDQLRELGQVDQSITVFESTLDTAVGEDQICRANIGLAEGLRIRGRYRDGLVSLSAAEAAAAAIGLVESLARVYGLVGNMHFPLGEIDKCMAAHEKALQYGLECGSTEVQARAYSGLADAHYLRGRMLSAGQMFERCIDIARENNLTSIISANLSMLGLTKIYAMEFAAAHAMFKEAIKLSSMIGDYRSEILGRMSLSTLLIEEGLFEEALETSQIAYDMSRKVGLDAFAAYALNHRSKLFLEMGQRQKAVEVADAAWTLIVDNHFEEFAGPFCLGPIARSSPDEERRKWATEEGLRLLSKGAVSHNHLFFYREIIEAGLERSDWELLQMACDALLEYTRAEPLPWSSFRIARAEAIHDFCQGKEREKVIKTLCQLKNQAVRTGINSAVPRIETALGEFGQ
ncbi:MAG TPA: adenylate/guanylate cyclase domain-containing protein [Sedimentisphaerales bacterium]|nr:adenylate/guanylate cyclase domain-containing protein [Sedimentisphaerales bacterium]